MKGLSRACSAAALVAIALVAAAGLVAGGVRLLPWLLDPAVSWRIAGPFARGLAAVAIESAILVGWPLGWSLACASFVERGHARVLQTLGERPLVTAGRLAVPAAGFAVALAAIAGIYGRDAGAPGAVATELVAHARTACAAVTAPATFSIPFTSFTWLCVPGRAPRLTGSLAGFLASSSVVSAEDARIAGDFRSLTLTDARILLTLGGGPPPASPPEPAGAQTAVPVSLSIHVGRLLLQGMAPWAQASILTAGARALVLATTGWVAAMAAAWSVLRSGVRSRAAALALGAAGPVVALALMRLLERMSARPLAFALLPLASACSALALGMLGTFYALLVRRTRQRRGPLRSGGQTASH